MRIRGYPTDNNDTQSRSWHKAVQGRNEIARHSGHRYERRKIREQLRNPTGFLEGEWPSSR